MAGQCRPDSRGCDPELKTWLGEVLASSCALTWFLSRTTACRMSAGCEVDMRAAAEILGKLKAISAAAEQGFGGTLRAASLLLTREMRHGGRWQVHLIDLAHFTETAEKRDDNFCDGLQSLIRTWEDWCATDVPQSWFTVCCITRK